jgi:hypothetical protein
MNTIPVELIEIIIRHAARKNWVIVIYFSKYLTEAVKPQLYNKIDVCKLSEDSHFIPGIIIPYVNQEHIYQISSHLVLNSDFINLYGDYLNWVAIIANQILSEENLVKFHVHFDEGCWNIIYQYNDLSVAFVERFADNLDLKRICVKNDYSESFLIKYADRLNWHYISQYQTITDRFLKLFHSYIHYSEMHDRKDLPHEYIRINGSNISENQWLYICKNSNIPRDIIYTHYTKIGWNMIIQYCKSVQEKFIEMHLHDITYQDLRMLYSCRRMSERFLEKYLFDVDQTDDTIINIRIVCTSQKLSYNFIDKYKDKLNVKCWEILFCDNYHTYDFGVMMDMFGAYFENEWMEFILRYKFANGSTELLDFVHKYVDYFTGDCWEILETYEYVSDRFLKKYRFK